MDKKQITQYILERASFQFTPLPEDLEVRGNCSAIDDITDKITEAAIIDRLERGDLAAWFCARVSCHFKGLYAETYLGGCSYNTFDEFCTNKLGYYYYDMIQETAADIAQQLIDASTLLFKIETDLADESNITLYDADNNKY
jgi:uncharacterized protein (DUF2164 family)